MRIRLDGDLDKMTVKLKGPADASDLAPQTKDAEKSKGYIFWEPRVDITFAKRRGYGADEVDENWYFIFGRDGASDFSYTIEDKDGTRYRAMPAEEVETFMAAHMPSLSTEDGEPSITKGTPDAVSEQNVRHFFNDIHLTRMGQPNDPVKQRIDVKRERYGYDAVMYLPEPMFKAGQREGEFMVIECDSRLIPDDAVEHAATRQRIEVIAHNSEVAIDEQTAASLEEIADGMPGGRMPAAVLAKGEYDVHVEPRVMQLPTTVMDTSVRYLLEHRDELQEVTAALAELNELFGEPVILDHIEYAIEATLSDKHVVGARERFEISARDFGPNSELNDVHTQTVLDNSFAALQRLAENIKPTLTSDELAVMIRKVAE